MGFFWLQDPNSSILETNFKNHKFVEMSSYGRNGHSYKK